MPPYLALALMMGLPWLLLMVLHKSQRRKMLLMSFAVIPFAFFDYFSQPAYWHPETLFSIPVGIEGVLFGFSFGGVASVIFPGETSRVNARPRGIVWLKAMARLSPVLIVSLGLYLFFDIDMMICLPIGLVTGCIIIIAMKPFLLPRLVFSALLFGLLYFFILSLWLGLFPQAQQWWNLEIFGNLTVVNVPAGEVLFGVLFGAFWSVFYEFTIVPRAALKPVNTSIATQTLLPGDLEI